MPKEILIYGSIDDVSASNFINNVNEELEENADSEIVVRVNSNGGSPEYGWGMVAKFAEIPNNKKKVKNDGKSYSTALYFNCYAEKTIAVDTAQFLLHRAAYPSWIENNPDIFSEGMRTNLDNINTKLRAAFEAKVDVSKFENLKSVKDKGITLDKVFSMDARIDVSLTAKEAKQIGLISEIIQITPAIKAEIEAYEVAASAGIEPKQENKKPNTQTSKTNKMTLAELQAAHPELFAQVLAMGIAKEKDRVEACLTFVESDAKGVVEVIASGKDLTQKQIIDFSLKAMNKTRLGEMKEEGAAAVNTDAAAAVKKPEEIKAEVEAKSFLEDVAKGI